MPGTAAPDSVSSPLADALASVRPQRMKLEENVEKILDAHPLAEVLTAMPGRESGPGPASCSGSVTVTFPSTADAAAYVGLAAVTHRAGPSIRGERRRGAGG